MRKIGNWNALPSNSVVIIEKIDESLWNEECHSRLAGWGDGGVDEDVNKICFIDEEGDLVIWKKKEDL